jgi:Ca-activated chloride channel family protein
MIMQNFSTITWLAPENKSYFILFAVALLLLAYRWYRSYRLIKVLGKTVNGHRFLHNTSLLRITIKTIFWALGLFFIFIVLLHPAWNKKEESVVQEGRDLFIALDISRSMLAQDVKPNRLEFAKSKIRSLVNSLDSERIGLILFSGSSLVQCPLTTDHSAFFMYLNQIDIDTIASGTTALDKAIGQAIQAFKETGTQKNKLLVIFSDGEDFSSNLSTLKNDAHEQGLTIFTIGIGSAQGAPIPLYDHTGKQSGHLRDANGTVVISQLNDGILQNLAQDVGGIYIHATHDHNDLNTLITLVQKHEKEKNDERKFARLEEQYPVFLLITFICLAIEWLL